MSEIFKENETGIFLNIFFSFKPFEIEIFFLNFK